MTGKFKTGDVVQLKSGGPAMTVKREEEGPYKKGEYFCQWFAGRKLEGGHFQFESLRKIEAPEQSDDGD